MMIGRLFTSCVLCTIAAALAIAGCGGSDAEQQREMAAQVRPSVQLPATWLAWLDTTGSSEMSIWKGRSDPFDIEWTGNDVRVGRQGSTIYSAREDANSTVRGEAGLSANDAVMALRDDGCRGGSRMRILSVVGPLMSVDLYTMMACPSTGMRVSHAFAVINMNTFGDRHALPPSLTELFDEKDLFTALMANDLVRLTLANEGYTKPPPIRSLDELMNRLRDISPICDAKLGPEMLRQFAFHHIEGNKVAVLLGPPAGSDSCVARSQKIELLLPIPPLWSEAILHAGDGTEGILMRELEAISAEKSAVTYVI